MAIGISQRKIVPRSENIIIKMLCCKIIGCAEVGDHVSAEIRRRKITVHLYAVIFNNPYIAYKVSY